MINLLQLESGFIVHDIDLDKDGLYKLSEEIGNLNSIFKNISQLGIKKSH